MKEDFESIRVLRFNLDEHSHEDFEEGNIVHIDTNEGMYGTSHKGKITWIDTAYIEVDCSNKYQNNLRKFNFKDILYISKIDK